MSPKGSKTGVTSTRREFLIGKLYVILCMMGARRWPKSAVELPPGQMQFGRPPTHQAGLVILGDDRPCVRTGQTRLGPSAEEQAPSPKQALLAKGVLHNPKPCAPPTGRDFSLGDLYMFVFMIGARRWPKSGVEIPPGQMQFGRRPTHQAG